jgi:hypothetical protein
MGEKGQALMAANALVLKFNADASPAKRAFTELAQAGVSQMAILGASAAAAGTKVDKGLAGSLIKAATAITGLQVAYAAFGAVAAASIAVAIDRLAEYRKLAEQASELGLSTDFFQKFTQSAGDTKAKIESLAAALKTARDATRETLDGSTVGNRIDEFSRNSGFTAAGEAARAAFRNAADAETRIRAATSAIDDLLATGRQLEALDLAEKLFGKTQADELIARATRSGQALSEMVNTTADKKVVSPEQIENARLLEERLEAARKTMADGMAPILADLEKLGVAFYRGWVNTEEAIASATKAVGAFYSALKSALALLPGVTAAAGDGLTGAAEAQISSINAQLKGAIGPEIARLQARRDALQASVNAAQGRRQLADDAVPVIGLPDLSGKVQLGPNDPLSNRDARPPRRSLLDSQQAKFSSGGGGGGKGGSSDNSDLEAYEKYVANIEKAVAALKAENETIGLGTFARERALGLAKAKAEFDAKDIELTEEQKAKLETLIEAQARLKDQMEKNKASLEDFKNLQTFIGTSISGFFSDVVSGGKNAEQALSNLTKKLADAALQAALLGSGPLAGLLGTKGENGGVGGLIGALFSGFGGSGGGGGAVAAGLTGPASALGFPSFAVGTNNVPRDMLAYIHQGEIIVPRRQAEAIRSGLGAAGAAGPAEVHLVIQSDGSLPAMIDARSRDVALRVTQAGIADNNRRIPDMLQSAGDR